MRNNRPILITGSHRSGTTWVGNVIQSSGQTNYILEPLNPGLQRNMNGFWFDHRIPKIWFPAIDFQNSIYYIQGFKKILKGNYGYFSLRPKSYNEFKYVTKLWLNSKNSNRVLLKDPIALFSSSWLHSEFNSQNIVLVRNPLNFISSLKKNNWSHDFSDFLHQKKFLKQEFGPYIEKISDFAKTQPSIVEQGILLSNMFNDYIFKLKIENPEWHFVSLESIASNPLDEFRQIFKFLDLSFNENVQNYLEQTTNSNNPSERNDSNVHVLARNSRETINNYKLRLTKNEIEKIQNETFTSYNSVLDALENK